jgi:hypothetical protein
MKSIKINLLLLMILISVLPCTAQENQKGKITKIMKNSKENTYSYDKSFLEKYCDLIELSSGNARVLLSKNYQGRVFTSTSTGIEGLSFGWIITILNQG